MTEVGTESAELEIANGILSSFACGSFIFVAFFEILQEEITPHDTSIGKIVSVAIGFAMIALLILIPEDSDADLPEMTTLDDLIWNFTTASIASG